VAGPPVLHRFFRGAFFRRAPGLVVFGFAVLGFDVPGEVEFVSMGWSGVGSGSAIWQGKKDIVNK